MNRDILLMTCSDEFPILYHHVNDELIVPSFDNLTDVPSLLSEATSIVGLELRLPIYVPRGAK